MEELDKKGYGKMFTQVYNELRYKIDPSGGKIDGDIIKHTFQTNVPTEERVLENERRDLSAIRFNVWNKIEDRVDEYSS